MLSHLNLDNFSNHDLKELSTLITELNDVCFTLTTLCSNYNINSSKDLSEIKKYEDPKVAELFNICTARLKKLQNDLDFIFIETD